MKRLVLDVENKVTHKVFTNRKGEEKNWIDGSPYEPENYLVSVGIVRDPIKEPDKTDYFCFKHNDWAELNPAHLAEEEYWHVQRALDETDLLICHNAKFDLGWLLECGFVYDGPVYCTMIAEYVMLMGRPGALKLEALAEQWRLPAKRSDLIKEYWDKGIGFEAMPWAIVEEYGRADCVTTAHLFRTQQKRLKQDKNKGLVPTIKMMCEFLKNVLDMERVGVKIDLKALAEVKKEYIAELEQLDHDMMELIRDRMGDTPINLDSPDDKSKMLYSRSVNDKKMWKQKFNLGKDKEGRDLFRPKYTKKQFNSIVKANTSIIQKTEATHCKKCKGKGFIYKETTQGKPYKSMPKCKVCHKSSGIIYKPTGKVAGFKLIPRGVKDVAAAGFTTSKDDLEFFPASSIPEESRPFIALMMRRNQVTTYLSTYVEGIEKHVYKDNILHTSLNQTIAATGRLSSTGPNLHNQPRGDTFPIRRVFVSRFNGGAILDADYSQLEFRAAGFLSGCEKVLSDINEGVDVHAFTRDTINNFDTNLEQIDRQGAKEHTFKPLYGGQSGTPREKSYYAAFIEKYKGVADWHETLKDSAIRNGVVVNPTGRVYAFPYAKRLGSGYVSGTTQIVNYPVQGFATGDLVPLGIIAVGRALRKAGLTSVIVLTVHDSILIDVVLGEEDAVAKAAKEGLLDLDTMCQEFYGFEFKYPINVDVKIGPNWLDGKEIEV